MKHRGLMPMRMEFRRIRVLVVRTIAFAGVTYRSGVISESRCVGDEWFGGAQNALVQGHKYAASGGVDKYGRGLRKFSLDLANKSHMGETPTVGITIRDENGNIRRHFQRDLRDEADRKSQIAQDVMPDEGQQLLEALGVKDRNNTMGGGMAATAFIDTGSQCWWYFES